MSQIDALNEQGLAETQLAVALRRFGVELHAHDSDKRAQIAAAALSEHGLQCVVHGRDAQRKPETFGALLLRAYPSPPRGRAR